jgi:hypothetical protein
LGETPFEGIPVLALVSAGGTEGENESELAQAIDVALSAAAAA